jgi:hypothetical protein
MAACHKSYLPAEVLHLHIPDHVTSYLLVGWRDGFVIIQSSESNVHLGHLLLDGVLPKSVTIFLVKAHAVIK